jgi:hypothetical protein
MKLFRHKKTNNLLKLKKKHSENVATFYVMNEDLTHKKTSAGMIGNKEYNQLAVCKIENIIEVA